MKNILFTKMLAIGFLVLINVQVWSSHLNLVNAEGYLDIYILDVGQGDSILIKTPKNHWAIIDAGRDRSSINEISNFMPITNTELVFLMASHPDGDHIGGMPDILSLFSPELTFIFKNSKETETFLELKDSLESLQNAHLTLEDDFKIEDISFNVIWPDENLNTYKIENVNNASYGLEIEFGDFTFLTMGDLESEYELRALGDVKSNDIDAFKLSHHGSQTSSSIEVLDKINPKVSFISSGENNPYGHPSPEVLDNLNQLNLSYYRTDIEGTIHIRTTGEGDFMVKTTTDSAWKIYSLD